MDLWKGALLLGVLYYGTAMGVLVYITQMSCSKQDLATSAIDAAVMSTLMGIAYFLMPYAHFLTDPVARTLGRILEFVRLGSFVGQSGWLAEAFVLSQLSWISLFWYGLRLQNKVCDKPSKKEKDEFRKTLTDKLHNLGPP